MPINLPANNGARVIDCFAKDHGEADFSVEEVHRQFIEQVVEVDDEAMENIWKKAMQILLLFTAH